MIKCVSLTCPIVSTLFKMEKSVACVVGARQECKQHTTREQTQDLYTQPLAGVSLNHFNTSYYIKHLLPKPVTSLV